MSEDVSVFKAIIAVMKDIGHIGKDQRNQQQGFNYRGIDQIYNHIQPLLVKHGLFITPRVVSCKREERVNQKGTVLAFVTVEVEYTIQHVDGGKVVGTSLGEGMDSGDKATSKAMSIAQKYFVFQTFMPPLVQGEVDDPDAESHVVVKPDVTEAPALSAKEYVKLHADLKLAKSKDEVNAFWKDRIVKPGYNKDAAIKDEFTKACKEQIAAIDVAVVG